MCALSKVHRLRPLPDVKTDDWSVYVKPFWGEVIKSSFSMQAVKCLFKAGMATFKASGVLGRRIVLCACVDG